ncbi:MAG TPA: apolipoprotein N-acyltransferase [Bacteroidales bacterium]|nr:apolipoprotein N-acyltransferase [Bacteroidales bacterium]
MKKRLWLVSLLGGLLCGLAWYDKATGLIMLTALVPFLYIFQYTIAKDRSSRLVFLRVLPGLVLFNLLTISWLRNASIAGTIYAVTASSFLMSLVFWIASVIYKRSSSFLGYVSLLIFWIIMEYINTRVSIFTPWLNLGNVLGNEIIFIQWYDITGVPGGTLWILLCNLAIFHGVYRKDKTAGNLLKPVLIFLSLFFIPSGISFAKYLKNIRNDDRSEIILVQPNIDPYKAKFSGYPFKMQLNDMLLSARKNINSETDWVILPETAIDDPFYEENVLNNNYYHMIDSLVSDYPGISLITGATTMRAYHENDKDLPPRATRIDSSRVFYEVYNTAMQVNEDTDVSFYHKSKLVPGIEKKIRTLPKFINDKIIPDLGGTMTGYGTQDERTVFLHPDNIARAAPVICYESVYGDFVTGYIKNGSNLIVIITNDGWWENTSGYRQHLMFARIRAIENRRSVARAANTGISCFIDMKGKIIKQVGWWEKGVISHSLVLNNEMSFYTLNGDFIYRYLCIFGVFILILTFIAAPLRKLRDPQNF